MNENPESGAFVDKKKTRRTHRYSSHTLVGNMREHPHTTKLVYSPRRPGRSVENPNEKLERSKSVKLTTSNSSSSCDGSQKRKSLQTLQPSADGQKFLVGGRTARTKNGKKPKQLKEAPCSKQSTLRLPKRSKDNESSTSSSEVETTSTRSTENPSDIPTSSDEAYSLMVQERAPEKYWELVAEERRKAIEEILQENLELHQMIEELKTENQVLREKANDTDYYATMYKIAKDDPKPEESKDV